MADESLAPLCDLRRLRHLELHPQYLTAEYARLSVALPAAECPYSRPYVELDTPIGDQDVMVVGKRKPFLNSKTDAGRLEKYEREFHKLQDEFRREL